MRRPTGRWRACRRTPPTHWFVGMAHGHFVEDRREPRSSLITPDEIAGSGLDYLALGHVHVFRDVSQGPVRACYPGAPRISYAPDAGSVAIIRLDPVAGDLDRGAAAGRHHPRAGRPRDRCDA